MADYFGVAATATRVYPRLSDSFSYQGRQAQLRAVVLAGGEGTRLAPYTRVLPKPLLPVGDRPILEIIIGQLRDAGITEIVLATGYLSGLIEAYFGDGRAFGVEISYSREPAPLGTAGPLAAI